jgi:hypothetical protein
MALEEEESKDSPHGSETIGWLAIEAGTGSWNGRSYEAAKTANAVTHAWYNINFGQSFSAAPRFIAALATYDGADSAHLRYQSLTSSGVQVMVEEDTTYDTETGHTTEVVSYRSAELAPKPGVAGEWTADGAGLCRQQRDSDQALLRGGATRGDPRGRHTALPDGRPPFGLSLRTKPGQHGHHGGRQRGPRGRVALPGLRRDALCLG